MTELARVTALLEMEAWDESGAWLRMRELLDLARGHLVALAQGSLRSTSRPYIEALDEPVVQIVRPGVVLGTITLAARADGGGNEALAALIENGCGPWDLRTSLLPGRNQATLRRSKEGHLYRHLAFRHGAPDDKRTTRHFPVMGAQFGRAGHGDLSRAHRAGLDASNAAALGRNAHRAARQLDPTRSAPGGGTQWGGRLDAGLAPILRARHATDLFAGMVRFHKTYERAGGAQYGTFRTISTNPGSHRADEPGGEVNWTHPGFTPRHFFPATQDYVRTLLDSGHFGELLPGTHA